MAFVPSSSTTLQSHQESRLFERLPLELRCLVLDETDPAPRQIIVRQSGHGYFICSPPPPVALQVCRESRRRALRRFKPFFTGRDGKYRPIYVRPQVDTLFFDLSSVAYFVCLYPEVHEFHTVIAPEVAMGWEWDAFPSAKRLLVADDLSERRHQRYYTPIDVVPDNSAKEDEEGWRRNIADYLGSGPEVCAVRIRSDKTWTYLLAKRELERMKAERFPHFHDLHAVKLAVSAFSEFGQVTFRSARFKKVLKWAAYQYLQDLDYKMEMGTVE